MKPYTPTASEMTALTAFWLIRTGLSRPVRRRLIEAGILQLDEHGTPCFTQSGTHFMLSQTIASKWPKPGTPAWDKVFERNVANLAVPAVHLPRGMAAAMVLSAVFGVPNRYRPGR